MSLSLTVQYAVKRRRGIPAKKTFERWAQAALSGRRLGAEFTLRIVGAKEGAALNQTYRGRPGPTNVLSFCADCPIGIKLTPFLGDIIICAPVVQREAREQGKALKAHWAHMTVHGVLHLLGYDHIKAKEAKVMEDLETSILATLDYPDPYTHTF